MREGSRADRRHHAERLKTKRRWYWSVWKKTDRQIGMLLHTAAMCSCHMCGNPREHWKQKSMQERRFDQKLD